MPLEVKLEQRVKASPADIQKQFDLAIKIRDRVSELHETVEEIREARTQLHTLNRRLGEDGRFKPIVSASEDLDRKITPVEEKLLQVNAKSSEANLNFPVMIDERLHSLQGSVDSADAPPTQQQLQAFEELSQQSGPLIAQWKKIMSTDLVALNDMIRKESVPVIYVAPPGREVQPTKAAGQSQ